MYFLVSLALIASIVSVAWKGYRTAFLYVYLPILICLPAWPKWILPALPDPTFQQAAILPIAAVSLYRERRRLSVLDILVFSFLLLCGVSEYITSGYAEAQNLMFDMIASGALPYIVARDVFMNPADRVKAIKIFVLCIGGVLITTIYEARFGSNPYRMLLDPLFPGQGDRWVTTFRYGFARPSGAYGHAILAGVMFMIAWRLQCWLQTCHLWKANWTKAKIGPFSLPKVLTFWTFLGLCVTWVRGPQLGALLAWAIFRLSRGRKPKVHFRRALLVLSAAMIPLSAWFYSYVSIGRAAAVTAGQESAAYRKELIEKYLLVVFHHAWFGWGRNGWPKVGGMPSIDNHYLLVSLMHGLPAMLLFLSILILVSVKLFRIGIANLENGPRSSLSFTLFSIYIGLAFSLATAYLGENLFPVFFFLLGLTDAFLREPKPVIVSVRTQQVVSRPAHFPRFKRVLA